VDEFWLVDVPESGFDLVAGGTQDTPRFGGAVVDESARDLPPAWIQAAHYFASLELARHLMDADGE